MKEQDHRLFTGSLAKGCRKCAKGSKLVLFVTGKCVRKCYYCPLSNEKMNKDVIYANEGYIETEEGILKEARAMRALGTGITGGEPLIVPGRTLGIIKLLKKEFGPNHHIHLYTTGEFEAKYVKKLEEAGLDEIRFHPPYTDWTNEVPKFKKNFELALKSQMDVGIEIPAIPGMENEMISLARTWFEKGMDFLNLNELEASETNADKIRKKGFEVIPDTFAIKGSKETAMKVLKALKGHNINFCSSRYKDAVQLRRRLDRRAKYTKRPYQILTEDSTLFFGIVEPGKAAWEDFQLQTREVLRLYEVPRSLFKYNEKRLEIAAWVLEEIYEEFQFNSFFVETYPSVDELEVERTPAENMANLN